MSDSILKPEEHVLSTLERDGSRRWLKPVLNRGRWLLRRRIVAWLLIAVFTAAPFIRIGSRPLILLDVPARRFTFFGYTFLPTDTLLLALLLVGSLLSIFVLTALVGRVWCGWVCPQTVYMEFLFRPIERFFDGTAGRGGVVRKGRPAWMTGAKYLTCFIACFYLANTFLAYFVGTERLGQWMTQSPIHHPVPFLIVAFVTVAMMLDFCFYREQICILMCPYGRFQSVLLDESSLIVSYDANRGEPRGKIRKNGGDSLPVVGDCVDCNRCVTTCPTGIDIRQGLQMECINCTQCIDACNDVMHKIGRAPDLIRYSSQRNDRQEKMGWRPRLFVYPVLMAGIFGAFLFVLLGSKSFDAVVIREVGSPWTRVDNSGDSQIRNLTRLKLTNRSDLTASYKLSVIQPSDVELRIRETNLELEPGENTVWHLEFLANQDVFDNGRADCTLGISSSDGDQRQLQFKLLGPR